MHVRKFIPGRRKDGDEEEQTTVLYLPEMKLLANPSRITPAWCEDVQQ